MATLTVNFPSQIQNITFTNGETAVNRQGVGYVNYYSGVKISSVDLAAGYLSWSGTLYWNNGTSDFAFATVSNGNVSVYSASSQEQIDFISSGRSITLKAAQSTSYTLTVDFPSNVLISVSFSNGTTATNRQGVGYVNYSSSVIISSASLGAGYSSWSGLLYWENAAGTTYSFGSVTDGVVSIYSSQEPISFTGNRTITIIAIESTYDYYWQYQYYTKSTGRIIGTSDVYSKKGVSTSAGYNVAVSDISAYSNTAKTGTYTSGRYCTFANGYFTISSSSSQGTPAVCYVQVDINTFTWHGSDTMDNNLIKPLASIRTGLTATAWNRFQDIMVLVGNAAQAGVSAHKTSTGSTVTAALLKSVLTELGKIESQQHTGITIVDPQTIVKNQTRVLASYFNGTNSIKDNLNNLVDSVNS